MLWLKAAVQVTVSKMYLCLQKTNSVVGVVFDSYEDDVQQPFKDQYNGYPETAAFDSYKQQSLQRFRHEEQYSTVQRARPPGVPEDRIQPHNAHSFDQALLIQAPPPKPERLYNTAE